MKILKFFAVILICCALPAFASRELEITHGLADYQVFQRDANNLAEITFGVSTNQTSGWLYARVTRSASAVNVLEWQLVTRLEEGPGAAVLKNMPTGGPYSVELELRNSAGQVTAKTQFKHIFVGDLWLLAGQWSLPETAVPQPAENAVSYFDFNGKWHAATVVQQHECAPESAQFFGRAGVSFAQKIETETQIPIGLVPCCSQLTSKTSQPFTEDTRLDRFESVGGKVTGVLVSPTWISETKLTEFIQSLRQNLQTPDLSVLLVQSGSLSEKFSREGGALKNNSAHYLREAQRRVAKNVEITTSIDLGKENELIYVPKTREQRLGARLAHLALKTVYGQPELEAGPRLAFVSPIPAKDPCYRLVFTGINGRLTADGPPSGFTVGDKNGNALDLIKETVISFDGQSIQLYLNERSPQGALLWYGDGKEADCNIADEADMALPAFGPVPLDSIPYETFVRLIEENPARPEIPFLLQRVILPQSKSNELLNYTRQVIAAAPGDRQVGLLPFLFALGDFSKWEDWLLQIKSGNLLERRELAEPLAYFSSTQFVNVDFIREWQMAGPFDNTDENGLDRRYSPERNPAKDTYENQTGESVTWQKVVAEKNGYLDFTRHIPAFEKGVVYVRVKIEAPREMEIPVLFGSNDGVAIQINHQEFFHQKTRRVARPAEELVLLNLRKGKNILLVKVDQVGGGSGLYVQLVARNGQLKISLP